VIAPCGDRQGLSDAVADSLTQRGIDLVVSAGYMRILGAPVVDRWRHRWINVHPALLPAFPGVRGVADALDAGVKVIGVTVHLVDEGVDTGPIILQEAIEVGDDDRDSIEPRVHEVEHRLLPRAVRALLEDRLVVDGRRVLIEEEP
jgi:phosphoribosylglycinamide formyltransferase-1